MGSATGLEPQRVTFTYPVGAASVNASLVRRRWLVVGWPGDDSLRRAKRFFRDGDGAVFLVNPGATGPIRIPLTDIPDGTAEGQFTRLEAGSGAQTLVVCANPDPPEPDAFDNLSVEFAVHRLPEMEERLLDAIAGNSGASFAYERRDVRQALRGLANDVR